MRKLLVFLLLLTALCAISGCGDDKAPPTVGNETDETQKTPASEDEKVRFNATEHGIVPNAADKAAENSKNMTSLLKRAKKDAVIFFPEGDFYFNSVYGCFVLNGLENVVFEGDSATLINSSYDPTIKKNTLSAGKSMMFNISNCKGLTFKNLAFDYAAYVQVCGKIVSTDEKKTTIMIDERYTSGEGKKPLTGDEYIMAVNVLDGDGNVVGDYYAPEDGFGASLDGNLYTIEGGFGTEGDTLIARFTLGNYASPTIFVTSASDLGFENVRSYSSPTATFYATFDNENFSFDGFYVAPPEGAEWLWGSNVDSIHIKGIRGTVTVKNSTFRGLGDDALNVHCISPKVTGFKGDTVSLEYVYGGKLDVIWSREGDTIEFYDKTFKLLGSGTVKKASSGKTVLENVSGEIVEGCFAFNKSASPHLEIENVTVDGGRARAFLIQARTATVKNCSISNLGLAAIILSPDLDYWGEMGPTENVEMSGLNISNVCTMQNAACLGSILVTNSHSGSVKGNGPLHGTVKITDSTFDDTNAPALYAILVRDLEFTGNTLTGSTKMPYYSGCESAKVE